MENPSPRRGDRGRSRGKTHHLFGLNFSLKPEGLADREPAVLTAGLEGNRVGGERMIVKFAKVSPSRNHQRPIEVSWQSDFTKLAVIAASNSINGLVAHPLAASGPGLLTGG